MDVGDYILGESMSVFKLQKGHQQNMVLISIYSKMHQLKCIFNFEILVLNLLLRTIL